MNTASGEAPQRIPGLPPSEAAAAANIGASANDAAFAEARVVSSGMSVEEIEGAARKNEHDRNERFRDHFERIAIFGLYLAATVFLVTAGTWFWHIVTPWHWLQPDQLSRLQSFVTGGVIVGVATGHIKKRLGS